MGALLRLEIATSIERAPFAIADILVMLTYLPASLQYPNRTWFNPFFDLISLQSSFTGFRSPRSLLLRRIGLKSMGDFALETGGSIILPPGAPTGRGPAPR